MEHPVWIKVLSSDFASKNCEQKKIYIKISQWTDRSFHRLFVTVWAWTDQYCDWFFGKDCPGIGSWTLVLFWSLLTTGDKICSTKLWKGDYPRQLGNHWICIDWPSDQFRSASAPCRDHASSSWRKRDSGTLQSHRRRIHLYFRRNPHDEYWWYHLSALSRWFRPHPIMHSS